ncbi:hypothetical protein N356_gp048 [Cellulophaga phage phi14:2]|uniref:Uncharacterized protein n=1 Tax=Cellulophaga phage phi14:2 TaxID=1327990 RepID=S0A2B0_9CAUD|nr:hypothetical protein N356_gp048 [Cellulophaga phage phi14:2]AGO48940.1 hypothetical protein Phi14:2_gp062 [Cellulophaga phage phi14:2]
MKRDNMMLGRTNTGFKGITKRTRPRVRKEAVTKFQASFQVKGQTIHIGEFNSAPEAVSARTNFITSLI